MFIFKCVVNCCHSHLFCNSIHINTVLYEDGDDINMSSPSCDVKCCLSTTIFSVHVRVVLNEYGDDVNVHASPLLPKCCSATSTLPVVVNSFCVSFTTRLVENVTISLLVFFFREFLSNVVLELLFISLCIGQKIGFDFRFLVC